MILAKTFKSGNSLVTVLPSDIVKYLKITPGDQIRYSIKPNKRVEIVTVKHLAGNNGKEQ